MLTTAFVLSSLSLLAIASPAPIQERGIRVPLSKRNATTTVNGVCDLDALKASLDLTVNKYLANADRYKNNTGNDLGLSQLHDDSTGSAHRKRAAGATPLTYAPTTSGDIWYGQIRIGSDAQRFNVLFDTSTADLFVPGQGCTTGACTGHAQFDPATTTSETDLNKAFSLTYGGPSQVVSGDQYSDDVALAGGTITVTGQTFGAASQYPSGLAQDVFPPDGVLGLAYRQVSALNAPTVFQNLVAQQPTTAPVFGVKLAHTGSELYLGGTDTALYTGTVTYTPVTQQGYWQVVLQSVGVNGANLRGMSSIPAIIDTSSPFVMTSQRLVDMFYKSVPGAKQVTGSKEFYTVPCARIPSVSLTFGGRAFTIPAALFSLGQISPGSTECIGALVGGSPDSFWTIGSPFLQSVYSIFDQGANRVGFATLA